MLDVSDSTDRSRFFDVACGLTKWCLNAAALVRLLPSAEVLILTNDESFVRQECAAAMPRIEPFDASLAATIAEWFASPLHAVSGPKLGRSHATAANLRKWQFLRHVEYEAIYASDQDVDFFYNSSSMASYAAALPRRLHTFVHSSMRLIATGDMESPINGGSLLLRPALTLYDAGVRVLATRRFNASHGFNLSGPPRQLLTRMDLVRFRRTAMVRDNTWDFVNGNSDQGLLSYVFLIAQRDDRLRSLERRRNPMFQLSLHCPFTGAYCEQSTCPLPVTHFWGDVKPWLRWPRQRCPEYFEWDHLRADGAAGGESLFDAQRSACAGWLQARRQSTIAREAMAKPPRDARDRRTALECGAVTECVW